MRLASHLSQSRVPAPTPSEFAIKGCINKNMFRNIRTINRKLKSNNTIYERIFIYKFFNTENLNVHGNEIFVEIKH